MRNVCVGAIGTGNTCKALICMHICTD